MTLPHLTTSFGFFDEGQGEPVILLHSSLSSSRQWRKLQQSIGGQYRLIGIDLLGYGDTPFPERTDDFRFEREVDLVDRVLEQIEGPVHLVGHSYGGAVALKTGLRHGSSRIQSIFAHEPVLFMLLKKEGFLAEWDELENVCREVARSIENGVPEQGAERFIDYWSGPGTWLRIAEDRKGEFARVLPKLVVEFEAISGDSDGLQDYRRLPMPVRLTAGDRGAQAARRVTDLLARVLPAGSVQIIAGGGHMAPMSEAEKVNPLITEFLAAHPIGE